MKLSEMIKNLQEIKEKHGDLECIYAADEEGNSYSNVFYSPSTGKFENLDFTVSDDDVNAVCIN